MVSLFSLYIRVIYKSSKADRSYSAPVLKAEMVKTVDGKATARPNVLAVIEYISIYVLTGKLWLPSHP